MHEQNVTEYDREFNHVPDTGKFSDSDQIQRLSSLGISNFPENVDDSTLRSLLRTAIQKQCRLLGANVFDYWADPFSNIGIRMTLQQQVDVIKRTLRFIDSLNIPIVLNGTEIDTASDSARILITLEGLYCGGSNIKTGKLAIDMLHEFGVRSIALQYNATNTFANKKGLTQYGKQLVEYMLNKGLLLDLAHSHPGVRKDTMDIARNLGRMCQVWYSHGCPTHTMLQDPYLAKDAVQRGLSDIEMEQLLMEGGAIGLAPCMPFFPNVESVIETILALNDLSGGNGNVFIGSDIGGIPLWSFFPGMTNLTEIAETLGDKLTATRMPSSHITQFLQTGFPDWANRALQHGH